MFRRGYIAPRSSLISELTPNRCTRLFRRSWQKIRRTPQRPPIFGLIWLSLNAITKRRPVHWPLAAAAMETDRLVFRAHGPKASLHSYVVTHPQRRRPLQLLAP